MRRDVQHTHSMHSGPDIFGFFLFCQSALSTNWHGDISRI